MVRTPCFHRRAMGLVPGRELRSASPLSPPASPVLLLSFFPAASSRPKQQGPKPHLLSPHLRSVPELQILLMQKKEASPCGSRTGSAAQGPRGERWSPHLSCSESVTRVSCLLAGRAPCAKADRESSASSRGSTVRRPQGNWGFVPRTRQTWVWVGILGGRGPRCAGR